LPDLHLSTVSGAAHDPALGTPEEPSRLLAALAKRRLTLDLTTPDLCFLAALYLRTGGGAQVSFGEGELAEVFEQVREVLGPEYDGSGKRVSHAIRRLREQRLLARVDGAGVMRSGMYALTRLAVGIAEFYMHEEALTRESLTLLTRTLLVSLSDVRAAAESARTPDAWREVVVAPLRVTVADLVAGIERRQRGFDVQQEDYQQEIGQLLQGDWFGAVDRCQSLLDSTSTTLRELNSILLRDAHQLTSTLQDIQELATERGSAEAEVATREVLDQVDRIASWGAARQRAWSEYYQYVHRFLRDVVRLDPERLLTQRLREQLAGKTGRAFALTVAAAPSIRLLRAVAPSFEKPPVRRPRKEPAQPIAEGGTIDPRPKLESDVRRALEGGAGGLVAVTREVMDARSTVGERFAAAGRIAEVVAACAAPRARAPRPWLDVDGLQIEDWSLPARRHGS
jgi:chromosome partition protein MukF